MHRLSYTYKNGIVYFVRDIEAFIDHGPCQRSLTLKPEEAEYYDDISLLWISEILCQIGSRQDFVFTLVEVQGPLYKLQRIGAIENVLGYVRDIAFARVDNPHWISDRCIVDRSTGQLYTESMKEITSKRMISMYGKISFKVNYKWVAA